MYIPTTKTWQFANGLRIVWLPQREINSFFVDVRVLLGSAHTANKALPHTLEHLVAFSPTRKFPTASASAAFIRKNSIEFEGATHHFYTQYTALCGADRFAEVLLLINEKLFTARFSSKIWQTERARITEEFDERVNDRTTDFLDKLFTAQDATLARPIGTEKELQQITLPMIQILYDKYYTPSNILLFCSGQAQDEQKIREAAKKLWGTLHLVKETAITLPPLIREKPSRTNKMSATKQRYFALSFSLPLQNIADISATDLIYEMLMFPDGLLQQARDRFGLYHLLPAYRILPDRTVFTLYGISSNTHQIPEITLFIQNGLRTKNFFSREKFFAAHQKQLQMLLTDFEFDYRTFNILWLYSAYAGKLLTPQELFQNHKKLAFAITKNVFSRLIN
ncbi:insulinase family protein [Patescibacteria group bacterium]|nr:insulinase family protein [Patescibacteria group bacterium]